jgi:4-hydroxy-3-polyprenylbenzoate decarboxylase
MDVLDHSCSKLGFGGKMCIDGTRKFEEEKIDTYRNHNDEPYAGIAEKIRLQFPEVKEINDRLLKIDIPCLILSVEKNRKSHIRNLHEQICNLSKEVERIKMILYVEHTVDPNDLPVALWRFCNNLDPKRDNILSERPSLHDSSRKFACLGLDGTRKTKEFDDFQREWPNIIVADERTIESVDKKWPDLGLGPLIKSPSLKFRSQLYGEEAAVR